MPLLQRETTSFRPSSRMMVDIMSWISDEPTLAAILSSALNRPLSLSQASSSLSNSSALTTPSLSRMRDSVGMFSRRCTRDALTSGMSGSEMYLRTSITS